MKKHVLIVGRTTTSIKNYLLEHDYEYTLLHDVAITKFPDKKFKRRGVCDFSAPESMLAAVDAIASKRPVDGVFVTYESYVLPASEIARHLGLPGLSESAALACTDKELMRARFTSAPEQISPAFRVVTSEEELEEFACQHHFPLIIKPANLAKSLLVTKSQTLEELLANYRKSVNLLQTTYAKYAPNRSPKLLVEEFLEGPIFSVDAFVDHEGTPHVLENVIDYQTGYDIGYEDNFHYSRLLPSKLPLESVEAIRHAAKIGCQALGMTSSPAHIEVILTKQGPRIVEIGARNGGYRERMHMRANGIDITANALALVLARPLDITPKRNDSVGVFELFPKQPGIFRGISNEAQLLELESLSYVDIKTKPGVFAGKSSDGYKMCAVVMLAHSDPQVFEKDVAYLNEHVHAVME